MDISVIIVVHNQSEILELTLRTLELQSFKGTFEVIVSDDGSEYTHKKGILSLLRASQIETKYIRQPYQNFRAALARNNAIKLAKGKLLLFLDGDIVPNLNLLENHFELQKERAIIAGNREWLGKFSKLHIPLAKLNSPSFEQYLEVKRNERGIDTMNREKNEKLFRQLNKNSFLSGYTCNLSVQRNAEIVFDEKFVGWGWEDIEMCCRLIRSGYSFSYHDEINSYHLESVITNVFRTNSHQNIVNYMRNSFYFFSKYDDISIENIFFGFRRFQLNQNSEWVVLPKENKRVEQLSEIINSAGNWLRKHNYDVHIPIIL